ncbi:MAG: hypothetical protein LBB82_05030 [Treponema sp.]|jgi:hypothetical protein|nr:hypothetical protein [Treponema sp.]
MPKKKSTNSKADILVILICLSGAAAALWLFWTDLTGTLEANAVPAAFVVKKERSVQRRFPDRILWSRLRANSPVYQGDFIRTASFSGASIRFPGGAPDLETELTLLENTFVRIRLEKGRPVIELSGGSLNIKSGGNGLVVESNGRRVEFAAGLMTVKSGGEGMLSVRIIEGSALIDSLVLEAGEAALIGGTGAAKKISDLVMINPPPEAEFESGGGTAAVSFSWTLSGGGTEEAVRLEIALDRRFTKKVSSGEYEGRSAAAELPAGGYWWRAWLSGGSSAVNDAVTGRITVTGEASPLLALLPPAADPPPLSPPPPPAPAVSPYPLLPPPAITRPSDGYVIGAAELRESFTYVFNWSAVNGANAYIFTLYGESASGVKEIYRTGPGAGTSYSRDLRNLGRGAFFWTVEAVAASGNVITRRGITAERRFTVDVPAPKEPSVIREESLYGNSK